MHLSDAFGPDLAGDANQDGNLTASDLRLIALMVQGSLPKNPAADCNHDGQITATDATCTQAKLADKALNPGKYQTVTTHFVYGESGQLLGEYSPTGVASNETIWLDNTPVALFSGSLPSTAYYIHPDHLNAPRAISDSTGKVVWRWDSAPFGDTAANEDPDSDSQQFSYNLRFPGQYFDKGTGLHYNGFRDYDPSTGRYIESDPIGLAGGLIPTPMSMGIRLGWWIRWG